MAKAFKYKFKIGDKVQLISSHINTSGQRFPAGVKGIVDFHYDGTSGTHYYDLKTSSKMMNNPHNVPEQLLKRVK